MYKSSKMCELISEFQNILCHSDDFCKIKVTSSMRDQIFAAGDELNIVYYMKHFLAEKENDYIRVYYKTPSFIADFYFKDGLLHKEDGPAVDIKKRFSTRSFKWCQLQKWMLNGQLKSKNNLIEKYSYYIIENYLQNTINPYDPKHKKDFIHLQYRDENGNNHRLYGPAQIIIQNDIVCCEWFYNGKEYNQYEYDQLMLCRKAIQKFKKNLVKNVLYNERLVCKDVARLISSYVY